MRNIDFYIDQAKENTGSKSDRQLSVLMGLTNASVSGWRTKRAWPQEETMVKLAEMAGIDQQIALLELGMWRTSGATQMVYKSLMHKLTGALSTAIILIISLNANPSFSSPLDGTKNTGIITSIHYHTTIDTFTGAVYNYRITP